MDVQISSRILASSLALGAMVPRVAEAAERLADLGVGVAGLDSALPSRWS